jgi:hypothetical protein
MVLGRGLCSNTNLENKEEQCMTAMPVYQDIMAADHCRSDSQMTEWRNIKCE